MSDSVAEALIGTVRTIASEVVREELASFRQKLQDICLEIVQAAFDRFVRSDRFAKAISEHAGASLPEESLRKVVKEEVASLADPHSALMQYLADHGPELLNHASLKAELDSQVLQKAKELFKRSAFSGSLDIKKAITKVVENILQARGITGANEGKVAETVRRHLKEHLGGVLRETICSEVRGFLSSEEMKELLDSKFRTIDLYLKTEVIPKVVKHEVARALEGEG